MARADPVTTPLLQQSPSVQLEVNASRELRADVVASPNPANALVTSGGLFAKRGRRRFPWVASGGFSGGTASAGVDTLVPWTAEVIDLDGLINLSTDAARIIFTEHQFYAWNARASLTLTGGNAIAQIAQVMGLLNGTTPVGVCHSTCTQGAAFTTSFAQTGGYFEAQPGDYLQLLVRFVGFVTGTATGYTCAAVINGWSLTA
jgi:hypothetical protein